MIDASNDLGAKPLNTFVKVILPLSLPGIVAGSMLVFIPVVGEYIIPEMLGGSDKLYFGKIIWDEPSSWDDKNMTVEEAAVSIGVPPGELAPRDCHLRTNHMFI